MGNFVSGTGSLQSSTGIDNVVVCPVLSKNYWQITRREFLLFNQRWPKLEIWPSALLRNVQNIRICMREKAIVFSLIQILIFWTLRNSTDGHISSLVSGGSTRQLVNDNLTFETFFEFCYLFFLSYEDIIFGRVIHTSLLWVPESHSKTIRRLLMVVTEILVSRGLGVGEITVLRFWTKIS